MKSIDRFQIIGFVLSTIISVVLLIRGQDTVSSIILGLSLAWTLDKIADQADRRLAIKGGTEYRRQYGN